MVTMRAFGRRGADRRRKDPQNTELTEGCFQNGRSAEGAGLEVEHSQEFSAKREGMKRNETLVDKYNVLYPKEEE
jgi:hypothetical protein